MTELIWGMFQFFAVNFEIILNTLKKYWIDVYYVFSRFTIKSALDSRIKISVSIILLYGARGLQLRSASGHLTLFRYTLLLVTGGQLWVLLVLGALLEAAARPRLVLLPDIIGGGGRAHRDLGLVPVSVVLQRVQNILGVGVDKVSPGLPQRVDNVVDEANLNIKKWNNKHIL